MKKTIDLDTISEEELLKTRICDLPIQIEGTWIAECVQQLYQELDEKKIVFKPECYLSDEWLTPLNEPVIGIPFYLAHPVLMKLEKKMMLEAEGETKPWCMQLLRHETGHAVSYAYHLHRRKKWKDIFGSSNAEYKDTYRYQPYSKSYVRHLDGFYAQLHPEEDFVETFAVWLTPGAQWEQRYKGWKAHQKLQFVDDLVRSIQGKEPIVKTGKKYWNKKSLRITLGHYYRKKRDFRAEDLPDFHDRNLRRIFSDPGENQAGLPKAHDVIRKYGKGILDNVANWTGERKYVINDLLKTLQKRAEHLKLVATEEEQAIVMRLSVYVTTLIMNYLYTGWYRGNRIKGKNDGKKN